MKGEIAIYRAELGGPGLEQRLSQDVQSVRFPVNEFTELTGIACFCKLRKLAAILGIPALADMATAFDLCVLNIGAQLLQA